MPDLWNIALLIIFWMAPFGSVFDWVFVLQLSLAVDLDPMTTVTEQAASGLNTDLPESAQASLSTPDCY